MENELRAVLEDNTAGSPLVKRLKWPHLTLSEIVSRLLEEGIKVAWRVVQRLLGEWGFKVRKQVKSQTKAPSRNRDEQFRHLKTVQTDYENSGNPMFSIHSKRKESLGAIQRSGQLIDTIDEVGASAADTLTRGGLSTTVSQLGEYETVKSSGIHHAAPDETIHDEHLPEYNATIHPQENSKQSIRRSEGGLARWSRDPGRKFVYQRQG